MSRVDLIARIVAATRETAYTELVDVLREQAREADGLVGVPGVSREGLRRQADAFELVARWVEREIVGRLAMPPAGEKEAA